MMENDLTKYLSKYIDLSEEEIQAIRNSNLIRACKKDLILLKEGQIAKECYLVLKGCIRSYYLVDGEEKTTEFFTENQPITPVSYIKNTPSAYYLSCVEDSLLSISNAEKTEQFLMQFPRFASLIAAISNELLANKQVLFDDFKNLSPENRYLQLLATNPGLVDRVPQYHLASFLGIKPQSLSRIRKRISQKSK